MASFLLITPLTAQDGYRITELGDGYPDFTLDDNIFYINPDMPAYLRPSDALLHDHFFQCIIACMKAATKPTDLRKFDPDLDLTPGGFNLEQGGWWSNAEGKMQLEVELRARLPRHEKMVSG